MAILSPYLQGGLIAFWGMAAGILACSVVVLLIITVLLEFVFAPIVDVDDSPFPVESDMSPPKSEFEEMNLQSELPTSVSEGMPSSQSGEVQDVG